MTLGAGVSYELMSERKKEIKIEKYLKLKTLLKQVDLAFSRCARILRPKLQTMEIII